jgi:hypothetical protein
MIKISKKIGLVVVKVKKIKSINIDGLTMAWANEDLEQKLKLHSQKYDGVEIVLGCDDELYKHLSDMHTKISAKDKAKFKKRSPLYDPEWDSANGMVLSDFLADFDFLHFTFHANNARGNFIDNYFKNFVFNPAKKTITCTIHYNETDDT